MLNNVIENTIIYMTDQYANYVLQFIISMNNLEINKKITDYFLHNIGILGKHKHSSNVIEKVFLHLSSYLIFLMIKLNNQWCKLLMIR